MKVIMNIQELRFSPVDFRIDDLTAVENEVLAGAMLRAERYRRSSWYEAYDLRSAVDVFALDHGGSESNPRMNRPPRVTADVGPTTIKNHYYSIMLQ
jgi:hypothetical protein